MREKKSIILIIVAAAILLAGCTWKFGKDPINEVIENINVPNISSESVTITFSDERMGGCGDFFVYTGDEDDLYYLTVNGDGDDLINSENTFVVGEKLSVKLTRFSPNLRETEGEFPFCHDIAPFAEGDEFDALSGTAVVTVSTEKPSDSAPGEEYWVDVELSDLQFEIDGKAVFIDYVKIEEINVGWYPG